VIVVVKSFHPPVPGFYWEPTGYTFGSKELIPIFFTVRKTILKIEGRICKYFAAVGTGKALRMEVLAHGFQTVLSFHFCRSFVKGTLDELNLLNC